MAADWRRRLAPAAGPPPRQPRQAVVPRPLSAAPPTFDPKGGAMSRPRQHRPIVTSLILAAAALAAGRARADHTLTTIDVPGARSTRALGINDAGQVVGGYTDDAMVTHGYLRRGGTITTIDVPGATRTQFSGINNAGQMVGDYIDSGGVGHGLLWSGGASTRSTYRARPRRGLWGSTTPARSWGTTWPSRSKRTKNNAKPAGPRLHSLKPADSPHRPETVGGEQSSRNARPLRSFGTLNSGRLPGRV
jgi:probable HAF family extracellular repeat protein